jgi:hypothetical protein
MLFTPHISKGFNFKNKQSCAASCGISILLLQKILRKTTFLLKGRSHEKEQIPQAGQAKTQRYYYTYNPTDTCISHIGRSVQNRKLS